MPGYDPSTADPGESRLIRIRDILRAAVTDLNTAMARDSSTSSIVVPSAMIELGDIARLWNPEDNDQNYVRVTICAGGNKEGLDFTARPFEIPTPTMRGEAVMYYTDICAFIHPQWSLKSDWFEKAYDHELAYARISAWVRGTLNAVENETITLTSREFNNSPEYDTLNYAMATEGYKGYFYKSLGETEGIHGIHIVHQGRLA